MTLQDATTRLAGLVAVAVLSVACSAGGDAGAESEDRGPNPGAPPTLAGGVALEPVDPARALVGEGLAYGQALPSEELAAEAYTADPEVGAAMVRRVHSTADGRVLATTLLLTLDGTEVFDEGVLEAYVRGVVGASGDGSVEEVTLAGVVALSSAGVETTTIGHRHGDLLVAVTGPVAQDVATVVTRQLTAFADGATGSMEPTTPLVPIPVGSVFVPVPTVGFEAIPPSEEEPPPDPPTLPGATAVEGRYGVVAGERRTTVWAFSLDLASYPSAEALEPALAALVSARAGGAAAEVVEVLDRVVQRATGADGAPSARAFRHRGVAILVEGLDPAQVDAVVSAWIEAL